jgi:outer membrane protein OmpA-like peptidoglycan-associated protein
MGCSASGYCGFGGYITTESNAEPFVGNIALTQQAVVDNFGVNHAAPSALNYQDLWRVAEKIKLAGSTSVSIEGFGDRSGTATYNLRLGRARARYAEADLREILASMGVKNVSFSISTGGKTTQFSTSKAQANRSVVVTY